MDWKKEAIDKLRCYEARRRAVGNIQKELRRLEGQLTHVRSASADGVPVSGGGSGREEALLTNIVHRQELEGRLTDARLWVEQVDSALGVLTAEERRVLERFYIHPAKGNVDRLCEELHIEQSTVYRKRDSALRRFTIALYGNTESG